MFKKFIKFSYNMVAIVLAFLLLLYLMFSSIVFQNYITRRTVAYLNDEFHIKTSIGEFSYDGWTYFSLRRVLMKDQKQDTLFYVGRLQFNLQGLSLDSNHFCIQHVVLDEGLCKLTTYKDSTFSIDVLTELLKDTSSCGGPPFRLDFNYFECMDSRFVMVDSLEAFTSVGYDPFNMQISGINFRSKHFKIINDSLHFDVRNFSCFERCGFEVKRMDAIATVCEKSIRLDHLDIQTPYSRLADYVSLDCNGWNDYGDFVNKVQFHVNMNQSLIDMKDVHFFAPDLSDYKYKAMISGIAKGPLASLTIHQVKATYGSHTRFAGKVILMGLPDIENTFIDVTAESSKSVKSELEVISAQVLPQLIGDLGEIHFKGKFSGFYKDFVTYGQLSTDFGLIETDLNMKLQDEIMASAYSGSLTMKSFDLERLSHNQLFGLLSFSAKVKGAGFDLKHLNTTFETNIDRIEVNHYAYQNLSLKGSCVKQSVNALFDSKDENFELKGSLYANLLPVEKHFIVHANLDHANLDQLHIKDDIGSLGSTMNADFYFKDLDENHGSISLEDTHYDKNGFNYRINDFQLESYNGEEKSIGITGDYVNGRIWGNYDFDFLAGQLQNWAAGILPNVIEQRTLKHEPMQKFQVKLDLASTANIAPLLFPAYQVSNLHLVGKVNSEQKHSIIEGTIGKVSYQQYQMSNAVIKLEMKNAQDGNLLFGFKQLGKHDTLMLGDFGLKVDASDNRCQLQYHVNDSNGWFTGKFNQELRFEPNETQVWFTSNSIGKSGDFWTFRKGMMLSFTKEMLTFKDFELQKAEEQVTIDGTYGLTKSDKNISIRLNAFNLSNINQYINSIGVQFDGLCNGYLVFKNEGVHDAVIGNMSVKNLGLDGDTLGNFYLVTSYEVNKDEMLLDITSKEGKIKNLKGHGSYRFAKNEIDLEVGFDDSDIRSFQAFVKDYTKFYGGRVGLVSHIKGPLNDPSFSGNLLLRDVTFRVEYLQTIYHFDAADVAMNERLIEIQPFELTDVRKHSASVSGRILHNSFSNLTYNIGIEDFHSFQFMNTTSKDNDLFYGLAYASGNGTITGSTNNVQMLVNAKSEKGTRIIINPFGAEAESGDGLYHFLNTDTTLELAELPKALPFGLGIVLNIEATPDAEIQMLFSSTSDDRIKANGQGKIRLELTPEGSFLMKGTYEINDGDYRFSAMNVVAKKFLLQAGSTIEWDNDPLTGKMNIVGIYKLRTTVSEIVNTANSADPNLRIPVECIINIKGSVDKPLVTFDLNFPDLQNNLNGPAASELNGVLSNFRREPELMNQQIVFLLISGKFIPITNSNNNVASSFGSQTVSDLLSKEAAGLVNKFVPGLDVGVDWLNATDPSKGRTLLLSASKRFLNNRLEVQGSFSNDNSQNNFLASYNIIKNGSLKAKVFNKNGFDPIYSRNVTTSGFGIYYRREFNHLNELFDKHPRTTQSNP